VSGKPHFGRTKTGLAVHLHTLDHLPVHSAYARLNKAVAVKITGWVGSMSCAWIFCLLALASLPAVLTQAFRLHVFPSWLISVGLIALVAWIAQTFLQLVLLSIILVGSNVQAEASDARAARTFEDAEDAKAALATALDRLDTATEGGIAAVLAEAKAARSSAEAAFAGVQALAAVATAKPGPAELAAAVRQAGEKVGQVHAMLSAAVTPAEPAPKASPPGPAGTAGGKGAKGGTP
jgi:hypothetical protein